MAEPREEEKILEIAIEEQRRVFDHLNAGYEQAKVKLLTFIGAGLALMTYLFSSGNLFVPEELYGKIFYFTGLI